MPSFYKQEERRIQGLQGSRGLSTEKPCRILLDFTFSVISASPLCYLTLAYSTSKLKVCMLLKHFWTNFGPKWKLRHKSLVNPPSTTDTSNLCLCTKAITPEINVENRSWFLQVCLRRNILITHIKMGVNCNPK